jgi:predicted nucleic acid-binding protein
MPDPLAIANTSPLLYLRQAGCLNILKGLYGYVIVPRAVQEELEEGSRQGFDVLVRAKQAGLISSVSAVVATLRGKGM